MRLLSVRRGFSLLELLTVIAIIAILLAFMAVAIMKVRETAGIAQSKNNMRQVVLAMQSFVCAHNDALPKLGYGRTRIINNTAYYPEPGPALFLQILPYLEGGAAAQKKHGKFPTIPLLLSPADPGASEALATNAAVSSYAANGMIFVDEGRLSTRFTDGTSNTIAFAEHYAFDCDGRSFPYWQAICIAHRPAFADITDVLPVTKGDPPVSLAPPRWIPAKTFQVAPTPKECSMFVAQTPHSSGMIVAMGDASVRQLAPSIGESLFWGAVTPNKGEILSWD